MDVLEKLEALLADKESVVKYIGSLEAEHKNQVDYLNKIEGAIEVVEQLLGEQIAEENEEAQTEKEEADGQENPPANTEDEAGTEEEK